MAIPLYEQARWGERVAPPLPGANPGLLFDKFVSGWRDDWGRLAEGAKQRYLKEIVHRAEVARDQIAAGLDHAHRQRELLLEYLKGTQTGFQTEKDFQTEWRFVSGLGSGHPFDSGFIWHRTLGVPYLPGSAVKGMMRAWASQWIDGCGNGENIQNEENIQKLERHFGPAQIAMESDGAGSFIVFDALPTEPSVLEVDVLNPHYQPYYNDRSRHPADYYSPVPVFFLTVAPEQSFRFALAPRPGVKIDQPDWEWLWKILANALQCIGAGGKTAVGYGTFTQPLGPVGSPPDTGRDETAVWLKQKNDNDLRFVDQNGREHSREEKHCQFSAKLLKEGEWYVLKGERSVKNPKR